MTADRLAAAIASPKEGRPVALMPYLTAGWPTMEGFSNLLSKVGEVADAIEIGVPFSDPMADGATIQATSRVALENGVNLPWILDTVKHAEVDAPCVLMSYLNPILAYGLERLVVDARDAGIAGFIVPDLPFEEGALFRKLCAAKGLGCVQLVTPVSSEARLRMLCNASSGFVYAVTVTGVTGTAAEPVALAAYLDRLQSLCNLPVCAGFGIASAADVARLAGHADGAIVGTALLKAMGEGTDPVAFLRSLL